MKNGAHSWRRRLLLTGGLVVVVGLVAGGLAYATIPGVLYGDINGCVKPNGDLSLIDPSIGDTCHGKQTPISWSRGYAQENRRAETNFSADGTYHAIVGSALLGGRNRPFAYVVTAKAIVHPNTSVVSECKLEAWRDTDIPRHVVDESQQGPTAFATHNLQAVVQGGPINLQLSCRAGDAWKVTQASIIGTQVGNAANLLSDDADPHSP